MRASVRDTEASLTLVYHRNREKIYAANAERNRLARAERYFGSKDLRILNHADRVVFRKRAGLAKSHEGIARTLTEVHLHITKLKESRGEWMDWAVWLRSLGPEELVVGSPLLHRLSLDVSMSRYLLSKVRMLGATMPLSNRKHLLEKWTRCVDYTVSLAQFIEVVTVHVPWIVS